MVRAATEAGAVHCGPTEFLTGMVRANSSPSHLRMQNGLGLVPPSALSTLRLRASSERTSIKYALSWDDALLERTGIIEVPKSAVSRRIMTVSEGGAAAST